MLNGQLTFLLYRIPSNIISANMRSSTVLAFPDVCQLVELFDGDNGGNCSRLDVASFHCILHVILRVEYSRVQGRALYLLLVSATAWPCYLTASLTLPLGLDEATYRSHAENRSAHNGCGISSTEVTPRTENAASLPSTLSEQNWPGDGKTLGIYTATPFNFF
jgi:hypothetical protein